LKVLGNFSKFLAILFESKEKKTNFSMYCVGEVSRFIMVDGGCRPYMLKA
jgi:hypothetical protein